MATANRPEADSSGESPKLQPWQEPINPSVRRRIQVCFEKGSHLVGKGQHDYAADMFSQCVVNDPGNRLYVQHFLDSLYRKYNNNKKGSSFGGLTGIGAKASFKKGISKKDWPAVIKAGVDLLKLNPWDTTVLLAMANACHEMAESCQELEDDSLMLTFDECELAYLKGALDAKPKDADVNKACALALARQGQFGQAIACWHRVELARPNDEEPKKAITELSVQKTVHDGKLARDDDQGRVRGGRTMKAKADAAPAEVQLSHTDKLRRMISENPAELKNYYDLSDQLVNEGKVSEAEEVLQRALKISGGELEVRERLEDIHLRQFRERLEVATERLKKDRSAENERTYKKLKVEINNLELEMYRGRCERHPENLSMKFELGLRLRRANMIKEAIRSFQEARLDPRHPGEVALNLGECFQGIKQYRLALTHYQEAAAEMPVRNVEGRKLALYRAGAIALHMKDREAAEKNLNALAALDFSYRDTSQLLDKCAELAAEEEKPKNPAKKPEEGEGEEETSE